jgi:hypothetical protein
MIPFALAALLFAALIHDAEHKGYCKSTWWKNAMN